MRMQNTYMLHIFLLFSSYICSLVLVVTLKSKFTRSLSGISFEFFSTPMLKQFIKANIFLKTFPSLITNLCNTVWNFGNIPALINKLSSQVSQVPFKNKSRSSQEVFRSTSFTSGPSVKVSWTVIITYVVRVNFSMETKQTKEFL